jgi:hypothetical protein
LIIATPAQARWLFDLTPIAVPETRTAAKQRASTQSAADPGREGDSAGEGTARPAAHRHSIKQQRLTLYANGQPFAHSRSRPACPDIRRRKASSA